MPADVNMYKELFGYFLKLWDFLLSVLVVSDIFGKVCV